MVVDDKYLKLLNKYILDKRTGQCGMISDFCLTYFCAGTFSSYYNAYMSNFHSHVPIFEEDFKTGSVVFLLPFGVKYAEEEMEKLAEQHLRDIKDFFGSDFRDDMVRKIPEAERQGQIRRQDALWLNLENWVKALRENPSESSCWI